MSTAVGSVGPMFRSCT